MLVTVNVCNPWQLTLPQSARSHWLLRDFCQGGPMWDDVNVKRVYELELQNSRIDTTQLRSMWTNSCVRAKTWIWPFLLNCWGRGQIEPWMGLTWCSVWPALGAVQRATGRWRTPLGRIIFFGDLIKHKVKLLNRFPWFWFESHLNSVCKATFSLSLQ